jgi:hypothetical protein
MMRIIPRFFGVSLISSLSLLGAKNAHALTGPQSIELDGGPLGTLALSGGADGLFYYQTGTSGSGKSLLGDRDTGANLGSAEIRLSKTSGVVQFDIQIAALGGTSALGSSPGRAGINFYITGPVKLATITIAPPDSPLTLTAGHVGSLEGYEDFVDYNNANIFQSDLWNVENSNSRGVSLNYNHGPIAATVTFGDGWDSGVFNFLQALGTYTFDTHNSLSVYYGGNLGRTGLNALTYGTNAGVRNTVANYGANYINSQMFGAYYQYSAGNLSLVPEVQYVYAKPDHQLGIQKFTSNLGAIVIADYAFGGSPYSLGGYAEYFDSIGTTAHSADNWFIAPGAEGVGLQVTPTWQYKNLFARVSAGYIHLINSGTPSAGYGDSGHGKDVFQTAVEAGVLF